MRYFLAALLWAVCLVGPARALDVITFEGLTPGTLITTQLQAQGIHVGQIGPIQCCPPGPGTVLDTAGGTFGVFNFGGSGNRALLYGIVGDTITIDFVNPDGSDRVVDFASLRVGDGDSADESWRVTFKDILDNVLNTSDHTTSAGAIAGGETVSFAAAGIHRIEVLGIGNGSGGGIDDVSFSITATPEPASFALFGVGMLGLGLVRRRRG